MAGKLAKHYNCPLSQRNKKHLFLIAPEDHDLPRRCEGFIKCKDVDDEGNITQQTEITVGHMKRVEGKSHLLIARQLNDMIDDVVWVRLLNPILEPQKVYKNATTACVENIEKFQKYNKLTLSTKLIITANHSNRS